MTNRFAAIGALCATSLLLSACGGAKHFDEPDGGTPSPTPSPTALPQFTFESGPVRPIALSDDGTRAFVVNTPDGVLEILQVTDTGLQKQSSVPVGVDPVAVAVRSATEVWVVNQVSDSVSIVDVGSTPPRVTRTLLVGDAPSDIVFAGTARGRAFITTAHRGQQRSAAELAAVPGAGDPQLTTASIGRADVWVFDPAQLGTTLGGTPLSIVTLPGDTPRALAVTPDGSTVYAAIFHSGNQTTVVSSALTCSGFDQATSCTISGNTVPGSMPGPATNYAGVATPRAAVIVKLDAQGKWRDTNGLDWSAIIKFNLPDQDVFAINASTLATSASYQHVGTTLFNMTVNPATGVLYVSNTDSRNDLRFEGPGTYAGKTLQGHLAESRITVIDPTGAGTVTPHHLNKHIDYSVLPAPAGVAQKSLATPLQSVVTADGSTLYVAAFGSSKVGVFATASLEDDSFDPNTTSANYVTVSGGGPGGLVLDETRHRLYVTTRFDNGVSVVDLTAHQESSHLTLHTVESATISSGRRFLYDAVVSSANGEAACASCHMFGDADQVAWDLGNPDADVTITPITIKLALGALGTTINGTGNVNELHPLKGPMTTQTLRGMVNHGDMHWRGDRVSGYYGTDNRAFAPYNSELAFKNFIVAFNSLLGKATVLADADMQSFSDFSLSVVMPPNPIRALDNSLTASQARGRAYYMGCEGTDAITGQPVVCGLDGLPVGAGHFSDGIPKDTLGFTCQGCHTLDPSQGFFGTDGEDSFEALPQTMKVPQLRNLYERVGMFGEASTKIENAGDNDPKGDQIRGFGFTNDGTTDTIFRFLQGKVFNPTNGGRVGFPSDDDRRDVEQFVLAYDNDLAPIVGQQVTLTATNSAVANPRIDLMVARAQMPFVSKILGTGATECDLVARTVAGTAATAYWLKGGSFQPDSSSPALSDSALRALAATAPVTYTCMPPSWGPRALDRDGDGVLNGNDKCPDDASCH